MLDVSLTQAVPNALTFVGLLTLAVLVTELAVRAFKVTGTLRIYFCPLASTGKA